MISSSCASRRLERQASVRIAARIVFEVTHIAPVAAAQSARPLASCPRHQTISAQGVEAVFAKATATRRSRADTSQEKILSINPD